MSDDTALSPLFAVALVLILCVYLGRYLGAWTLPVMIVLIVFVIRPLFE